MATLHTARVQTTKTTRNIRNARIVGDTTITVEAEAEEMVVAVVAVVMGVEVEVEGVMVDASPENWLGVKLID
jgi:cytochrome P450